MTAARTGAARVNVTASGEFLDAACNCYRFASAGGSSPSISAGAATVTGRWGRLACDGTLQGTSGLSWSPVSGASSYNVTFSKAPSGPFAAYTSTSNQYITISDPTKSGYYYVTAVTTSEGPPSNVVQALFFSQCP